MVHAKQPQIRIRRENLRAGQQFPETAAHAPAHIPAIIGKSSECHAQSPRLQREGARLVENMDQGMEGQQRRGDARTLVIARHEHHRHPRVGDALQGLEGHGHQFGGHPAPIQQVPAMDDDIHPARQRGLQRPLGIGEEIRAAPAPLNAGPERQVESEVGIGKEQHTGYTHRSIPARVSRFQTRYRPSRNSTLARSATRRFNSVVNTRIRS